MEEDGSHQGLQPGTARVQRVLRQVRERGRPVDAADMTHQNYPFRGLITRPDRD